MKRMFQTRIALAAAALIASVLIPSAAQAQYGRGQNWDRDDDNWQRRRPPVRHYWDYQDIKDTADHSERQSNSLRDQFERDFDRHDWGRRPALRDTKQMIQRMDESMEDFRHAVDSHHPWSGRDELQRAIRYARDLRTMINRNDEVERSIKLYWIRFHADLNRLATIYDVKGP